MKPEELFDIQTTYYNGNRYKAWQSLSEELRLQIPEPPTDSTYPVSKRRRGFTSGWYRNPHKYRYRQQANKWAALTEIYQQETPDGFELDHIVPIAYGFKHGIVPWLISSEDNLQYIPKHCNYLKSDILTERGRQILLKWGFQVDMKWKRVEGDVDCGA